MGIGSAERRQHPAAGRGNVPMVRHATPAAEGQQPAHQVLQQGVLPQLQQQDTGEGAVKRKSLRDTLIENQKALDAWAIMHGKPQTQHIAIKPMRERAAPKPSEIPSEHQEQVAFVKWFRMQYRGVKLFAVPNAAIRTPQQAAWAKAEGLQAGTPDLFIPAWCLAIEFKRVKGGKISPEQQEWADYLLANGWRHFFAYGCEDAIRKCKSLDLDQGAQAANPV